MGKCSEDVQNISRLSVVLAVPKIFNYIDLSSTRRMMELCGMLTALLAVDNATNFKALVLGS